MSLLWYPSMREGRGGKNIIRMGAGRESRMGEEGGLRGGELRIGRGAWGEMGNGE